MSDADLQQAVSRATQAVLETMFFADVSGAGCPSKQAQAEARSAWLQFQGSFPGELEVSVSPETAGRIACDFLGADDPAGLGSARVEEVLLEMANMICGSVLSHLDNEAQFELSSPRPGREPRPPRRGSAVSCCFDLGDGHLRVRLALGEPV